MKVTCTDVYDKKHIVDATQLIDRLSVYGVYIADGAVLLTQDPRSLRWELPGGGVEKGETPAQGLVREFVEETGVTASGRLIFINEWEECFFNVVDQQAWRARRMFYQVEHIQGQENLLAHGNGDDSAAARLVSLEKLDTMHVAPRIRELIKAIG